MVTKSKCLVKKNLFKIDKYSRNTPLIITRIKISTSLYFDCTTLLTGVPNGLFFNYKSFSFIFKRHKIRGVSIVFNCKTT